ncbi:glycosyltransferase family 2 protein [Phycicoccus sp. Soil748]|uniref:glycosyltransferase family 2 protein n=1 Tax=Phycicoccus sp. Soil748 TaxID=1736397 RepID=UPI000702A550|nr:glycosyltransferase family 2 protein [Phycicoccus sp. Soil748]KRE57160.1 glycosyl transferase family 2 [Phycicoccus sp. Soil748]
MGTRGRGKVLVVVPAYNEAEAIAGVVASVTRAVPTADILVVDDGSCDATSAVARAAGARVATLPFNLGVGGAMRTGFRHAKREGYSAVVQVDGDGQHDPAFIPQLLAALEHHDVAVGARFAGTGDYVVRGPRRWAMRGLASGMSALMTTRLDDATSGFRACGPRAISVYAQHYPAEYLGDTLETLVIARKSGLTVTQVPVAMRHRNTGRPSHGSARSSVELLRAGCVVMLGLVREWPVIADSSP